MHDLRQYVAPCVSGIIVGMSVALLFSDTPIGYLENLIGTHIVVGSVTYVLLLVLATVFAPVTVFPLIPTVAVLLGPFLTGLLSVIGWTIGSVCAFLFARHAGRPTLQRFVSLSRISRYEQLVPDDAAFLTVVALRMLIPVDILSYLLGLFSSISLFRYTLATVIGVTWFSFVFAYFGTALYEKNWQLFFILGLPSLAVVSVGWYMIARRLTR